MKYDEHYRVFNHCFTSLLVIGLEFELLDPIEVIVLNKYCFKELSQLFKSSPYNIL